MGNDNQRREVAAKMRELYNLKPDRWLDRLIVDAMDGVCPVTKPFGLMVADLIDRETCEFEDRAFWNGRYAYGYTCSRCLAKFGEDTADQWFYCPMCGAEVLDEDGAN